MPARILNLPMLSAACALALLVAPTSALGATVSVEETPGETNSALLTYLAGPESNQVTMAIAGRHDGLLDLRIADAGAPIEAGAGCNAGVGGDVICAIHEPRAAAMVSTGFKGFMPVPGTQWVGSMRVELGDGDNSLDASSTGEYENAFAIAVSAGAGRDHIDTGGGDDQIDPGAGEDLVRSGNGADRIETTAIPDGPDVYELGNDVQEFPRFGADEIDYGGRTAPVLAKGTRGGAPGEGDRLLGVQNVIGGSGDDKLTGHAGQDFFWGGPGDDILSGGDEWDELYGGPGADRLIGGPGSDRLVGEGGDDLYRGGPDGDWMRERDGGSPPLGTGERPGADIAFGGGGIDLIETGRGGDRLHGGVGGDRLHAGPGFDTCWRLGPDSASGCNRFAAGPLRSARG